MAFFDWMKKPSEEDKKLEYQNQVVSRIYKILPTYEQCQKLHQQGYSQGNPYGSLASYLYKLYMELLGVENSDSFTSSAEMYQVINTLYGLYRVFNEFDESKKLTEHKDIRTAVFGMIPIIKNSSNVDIARR